MAEHEAPEAETEEGESWWEKGLGDAGLAHAGTELHAAAEASEGTHFLSSSSEVLKANEAAELGEEGAPGMSSLLAPLTLASGINTLIHGDGPAAKLQGGLETTSGAIGTAGLAGQVATGLGAEGLGASMTGAAAAAAPVAAVAGAGAAGMEIGHLGNEFAAEHDLLGQNDDGTNRNWSDMASDWGVAAHDWAGDGVMGDVAGIGATAAGSLVGAAGAAVTGVAEVGEDIGKGAVSVAESIGSGIGSVGSAIGSGISSLFSW